MDLLVVHEEVYYEWPLPMVMCELENAKRILNVLLASQGWMMHGGVYQLSDDECIPLGKQTHKTS